MLCWIYSFQGSIGSLKLLWDPFRSMVTAFSWVFKVSSLINLLQWSRISKGREERGRGGLCSWARPHIHGNIGQDRLQCRRGIVTEMGSVSEVMLLLSCSSEPSSPWDMGKQECIVVRVILQGICPILFHPNSKVSLLPWIKLIGTYGLDPTVIYKSLYLGIWQKLSSLWYQVLTVLSGWVYLFCLHGC